MFLKDFSGCICKMDSCRPTVETGRMVRRLLQYSRKETKMAWITVVATKADESGWP